jgi:hypothetical protein
MHSLGLCRVGVPSTGEPIPAFLGRGWNEITDADLPSHYSCLDPVTTENPGLVGATIESRIKLLASSSQINDEFKLDARISGSIPIEGVPVAGTLEGDILRMSNVHQGVLNVVARTAITYRTQRISVVPALSPSALSTLNQGALAFRDKCGDKFVDEVSPGGEFIALIQIFSRDTATQSKMATRVSAILGAGSSSPEQTAQALTALFQEANLGAGAGVDTGGSVSSKFHGKELLIQIETLQRGGSNRSNVTNVGQLIERYRTFPATVTRPQDTVPMGFKLKPYTAAGNGNQVSGRLFGIGDRANLVTNLLWPTYMNYLTAQDALTFWLEQCGGQPQACGLYFPYDLSRAQTTLSQVGLTLANIEAAVDQCGRGQACTQASLQSIVPADRGTALLAGLPVRKQFYIVGARAFKEAARNAGADSKGTIIMDPTPSVGGQCVIDQKEGWNVAGLETAQWQRIWTLRGVTGTTCRFEMFKGGTLRAPWDVFDTDFDIKEMSGYQVIEHTPNKNNLTLKVKQTSPLVNLNPDTSAILKSLTLVGPPGDPATEPWRQAIRD